MDGGGNIPTETFVLGDIGDYTQLADILPILTATIVVINAVTALVRLTSLGGVSMNAYVDTFGLEGVLVNTSLIVLLFQVARWIYTTSYAKGGKLWSPFVFVCIILAVEFAHDLLFYYGPVQNLSPGKNDMIDAVKRYAVENGSRALAGHAAALIFISVIAMLLKESSDLFNFIVVAVSLYTLPYLITTVGVKPPPPPPPPKKESNDMSQWKGPRF